MKVRELVGVVVLGGLFAATQARGQVVTNETLQVEISPASSAPIEITTLDMPPLAKCMTAEIQLKCNNKTTAPIKATVFCDLVFLKDPAKPELGKDVKEIYDALSFHALNVPPGTSTCTVVFSTLNVTLKGEGKLKTYLAERVDPQPPPPRIWFRAAEGEVATLDKPFGQVYQQLQLHLISNALLMPAKTTE